jgi:hypothetical protein
VPGLAPGTVVSDQVMIEAFVDRAVIALGLGHESVAQIYLEATLAMKQQMAECGASQIVIGTDYAVPWVKDPVDLILDTPTLSDADRIAILGGTAARLLKIASRGPALRKRRREHIPVELIRNRLEHDPEKLFSDKIMRPNKCLERNHDSI